MDRNAPYVQLCEAIQQEVEECQTLLKDYEQRIKKYENFLKEGGSGSVGKDVCCKIRWTISEKGFVSEITDRLKTRIFAINLLTTVLQLAKTDINDVNLHARLEEIRRDIVEARHDNLLNSLKDEIARNNALIDQQTHSLWWLTLPNVQEVCVDLFDKLWMIAVVGQETLREVKWTDQRSNSTTHSTLVRSTGAA